MRIRFLFNTACLGLLLISSNVFALVFNLPPAGDNVVGNLQEATVEPGDNFHTIGRRYDIGYYELIEANPTVDPNEPRAWSSLIIPSRFILPDAPRTGIVLNLAELRLYYYPPNQNVVYTYPVGIGREGWNTPLGTAKVTIKTEKPTWVVPQSILEDAKAQGIDLPPVVPPGPENPLGEYRLRLSIPSILIHGTNNPNGVGMRSSAGCIRAFPEDIKELFYQVKPGTPVRIIDSAYKIGWDRNRLYLEVHLPLQEQRAEDQSNMAHVTNMILEASQHRNITVDWNKAQEITDSQSGVPQRIGEVINTSQQGLEDPEITIN